MSPQDVEALLRAELADVADGVETGPAPVRTVVARGRTARRRRRAAGVAGAVVGVVAAVSLLSALDVGAVRSGPMPPAATTEPPKGRPDRDRDKDGLPSRAVMVWVAGLPASPQPAVTSSDRPMIGTLLDADGFPRLTTPDGTAYVTLRPVGAGWELQLRADQDDIVLARAQVPESAQPLGWVGGSALLFDLGGGPGLWRPGDAPQQIDGTTDTEEVAAIGGNRLLLTGVQGPPSSRCSAEERDARVVEIADRGVSELWTGCAQTSGAQLSPDGRWVVDSRNWFVPIEVSTGRPAPGATGVDTGGAELDVTHAWDPAGRWLQIELDVLSDGRNVRTFVRCTIADGTCVRLTDPDAEQTDSPT